NADDGGEVQLFDRFHDGARRIGQRFVVFETWIKRVDLPNLAAGPPARIAKPRVSHIRTSNLAEAARRVETRSKLVGETLVVDKSVRVSRADGPLIKILGVELSSLDAGDFGADQRGSIFEVLRTMAGPGFKLPMMNSQRVMMGELLRRGHSIP